MVKNRKLDFSENFNLENKAYFFIFFLFVFLGFIKHFLFQGHKRRNNKLKAKYQKKTRELQEKDDQEKKEIEGAIHQLDRELHDRIKKAENDSEKAFGKLSVRRNKSWISEKLKK